MLKLQDKDTTNKNNNPTQILPGKEKTEGKKRKNEVTLKKKKTKL